MNLYRCSRCMLIEDQDIVQDPDRKIGLVMHLIWPYDQAYAKDRIYLCLDCMQEVKKEVLKMREYYEDMAINAQLHIDHDCGTPQGQGCQVCADGYGKDY